MVKAASDKPSRGTDGLPADEVNDVPKSVFVISPIGHPGTPEHKRARQVLEYVVKKAFPHPAWRVIRADDESSPDSITSQVIDRIVNSDLIVADLTGHNPNVFYELAVAHGYQKAVLYLITEGEKLPFDVIDQRAIFYDLSDPASVDQAIQDLVSSHAWVEEHGSTLRTPLTMHGRFTAISESKSGAGSNEAIASALEEMLFRLQRLERETVKSREAPRPSWRAFPEPGQTVPRKVEASRRLSDEERMFILDRVRLLDEEIAVLSPDFDDETSDPRLPLMQERDRLWKLIERK